MTLRRLTSLMRRPPRRTVAWRARVKQLRDEFVKELDSQRKSPSLEGQILISTLGDLEAIGAGIPRVIGSKLARPHQPVFLHTGDGSFGCGAMEFETAPALWDPPSWLSYTTMGVGDDARHGGAQAEESRADDVHAG